MCMLYFKHFRRSKEVEPSDIDIYKFLLYLFIHQNGRQLNIEEIRNYIDNPDQFVLTPTANRIIERFDRTQGSLRVHTDSPKTPSQGGGVEKEYIAYNGHRYVVRKEKNKKCIVSKRETIYLSNIRGQYKKC